MTSGRERQLHNPRRLEYRYFGDRQRLRDGEPRADRSTRDDTSRLPLSTALIVVVVLSLGLWWVIWQAVRELIAAWPF